MLVGLETFMRLVRAVSAPFIVSRPTHRDQACLFALAGLNPLRWKTHPRRPAGWSHGIAAAQRLAAGVSRSRSNAVRVDGAQFRRPRPRRRLAGPEDPRKLRLLLEPRWTHQVRSRASTRWAADSGPAPRFDPPYSNPVSLTTMMTLSNSAFECRARSRSRAGAFLCPLAASWCATVSSSPPPWSAASFRMIGFAQILRETDRTAVSLSASRLSRYPSQDSSIETSAVCSAALAAA